MGSYLQDYTPGAAGGTGGQGRGGAWLNGGEADALNLTLAGNGLVDAVQSPARATRMKNLEFRRVALGDFVASGLGIGRRFAYDGWKSRAWVICQRCARWNLPPVEERLDTIAALASAPGVTVRKPEGAFYLCAKLPIDDAERFGPVFNPATGAVQGQVLLADGATGTNLFDAGLAAGDTLVVRGGEALREGAPVKVIPSGAGAAEKTPQQGAPR